MSHDPSNPDQAGDWYASQPDGPPTQAIIRPILFSVYGESNTTRNLAIYLADKIDTFVSEYDGDTRDRMIQLTCWNWFPGGCTASFAANKIEAALEAS